MRLSNLTKTTQPPPKGLDITMIDFNALTDTDIAMALYGLNKADCGSTVLMRERNTASYIKARDALHVQRMVRDMHQLRLTNRELAAAKSADQAAAAAADAAAADDFNRINLCPILNNTRSDAPLDSDMKALEASQRLIALFTA